MSAGTTDRSLVTLAVALFGLSTACLAQTSGNYGGEAHPWVTLDASLHWIADQRFAAFSAALMPSGWRGSWLNLRRTSFLQGTIVTRTGVKEEGHPLQWRFSLLDIDAEKDLLHLRWTCQTGSSTLEYVPEKFFSWHWGLTLFDLDHTIPGAIERRWVQVRAGLVQRLPRQGADMRVTLRSHLAIGAATTKLGEEQYASLGDRVDETWTGVDPRALAAVDLTWRTDLRSFLEGSFDAEARMLPAGFDTWRGTLGGELQYLGAFGCSGMGGGLYLRAERQWTQVEDREHRLDKLAIGVHLGLLPRVEREETR